MDFRNFDAGKEKLWEPLSFVAYGLANYRRVARNGFCILGCQSFPQEVYTAL
jgi:hypothetical protein